jgi:hypothetical protein
MGSSTWDTKNLEIWPETTPIAINTVTDASSMHYTHPRTFALAVPSDWSLLPLSTRVQYSQMQYCVLPEDSRGGFPWLPSFHEKSQVLEIHRDEKHFQVSRNKESHKVEVLARFYFSITVWEICSPVQTQRMDSETCGVQWKWDFNKDVARLGAWQAETLKTVTTSIILSSVQVPPPVPHWLSTMSVHSFPARHIIPIGLFKICFLG